MYTLFICFGPLSQRQQHIICISNHANFHSSLFPMASFPSDKQLIKYWILIYQVVINILFCFCFYLSSFNSNHCFHCYAFYMCLYCRRLSAVLFVIWIDEVVSWMMTIKTTWIKQKRRKKLTHNQFHMQMHWGNTSSHSIQNWAICHKPFFHRIFFYFYFHQIQLSNKW